MLLLTEQTRVRRAGQRNAEPRALFSFHVGELPKVHITRENEKKKEGRKRKEASSLPLMPADGMLRPNATFPWFV